MLAKNILYKTANFALNFIYPPQCLICKNLLPLGTLDNSTNKWICIECFSNLDYLSNTVTCSICGTPIEEEAVLCGECFSDPPNFDRNVSVMKYYSEIRTTIHKFKYDNRPNIAEFLAELTYENINRQNFPQMYEADYFVPVPISRQKLKKRGYNQATRYAVELSKLYNIPVADNILVRTRDTAPQAGLSGKERKENIKEAFSISENNFFREKSVVIVDDIFTTGATLNECTKVIKLNGGKYVYCLTFAITSLHDKLHDFND